MRVLVLSDSHSGLSFMRFAIAAVRPDVLVHLGDHYDDGEVMAGENPWIRFFQVPGNCDLYRCVSGAPEIINCSVAGVKFYMTHGHRHGVKSGIERLVRDARACGADVALYGHTHQADCHEEEGLWVLNPGACGSYGGSVGLIEIEGNKISACRILRQADLELLP